MSGVKLRADIKQIEKLGDDFETASEVGLRRVLERGEQILRDEVPKATHNLEQGVSSDVDPDDSRRGYLIVSASRGRMDARKAVLHLPSGKTKEILLRAQPSFDYAEVGATGSGVYGPKGAVIKPKKAKALLVPVGAVPTGKDGTPEAYVESGGHLFVMRGALKGKRPNPYDARTAKRLEAEAQGIYDRALEDVMAEGEQK